MQRQWYNKISIGLHEYTHILWVLFCLLIGGHFKKGPYFIKENIFKLYVPHFDKADALCDPDILPFLHALPAKKKS